MRCPPNSVTLSFPADRAVIGLDDPLNRLDLAQNGEERLRVRAGYSAVDILGHVSNSRYVEWICDAFPLEVFRQHQLDWMQTNYDHEILPGEEVSILTNTIEQDDALVALEGFNRTTNARAFEALVHWQDRS